MVANRLKPYIAKLGLIETNQMSATRAAIYLNEKDFNVLKTQIGAYIDEIQSAVNYQLGPTRKSAVLALNLLLVILYEELELWDYLDDAINDAFVYASQMYIEDGIEIYSEILEIL